MMFPGITFTTRRLLLAGLLCAGLARPLEAATPAAPAASAPESLGPGVQVDWSRGTLRAAGSCAADLFAASAEIARVKAERLARNRAEARLRRALQTLTHEPRFHGKVQPEILAHLDPAQAKVAAIEYAATGSVSLQLELSLITKPAAKEPTPPVQVEEAKDGGPAAAVEGEKSP